MGGLEERPLEKPELERIEAELAGVAAELAAGARFLAESRERSAWEVEAALRAYQGLYERIAAVLAALLGADERPDR